MSFLKHFMGRVLFTLLLLAVPVLGVWTFVKAPDWGLWFPPNVASFGDKLDDLFNLILALITVTFLLTEVVLVWFVWRFSAKRSDKAVYSHGSHKLELIWTAIPAVILTFLAFTQMSAWNEIKITFPDGTEPGHPYSPEAPLMEVYASQFDWRARYPDEEGNFQGKDIVESAFNIYVPVNTKVVFRLRSRDVLHSFFVPNMRLKQDAVPGLSIPVWFEATEVGEYDLICAELCGWGHYKMAGRINVLEKDEFDSWLTSQREALYSNGSED